MKTYFNDSKPHHQPLKLSHKCKRKTWSTNTPLRSAIWCNCQYEKLPQTIAILCYPESIRIIIWPCRSVENFHFHLLHAMSTFIYISNIEHCMRPTEELYYSNNNSSNCNINRGNKRNTHNTPTTKRKKKCALHYLGVERRKKCRKWLHAACNRIFYESGLVRKAKHTN